MLIFARQKKSHTITCGEQLAYKKYRSKFTSIWLLSCHANPFGGKESATSILVSWLWRPLTSVRKVHYTFLVLPSAGWNCRPAKRNQHSCLARAWGGRTRQSTPDYCTCLLGPSSPDAAEGFFKFNLGDASILEMGFCTVMAFAFQTTHINIAKTN